ncbi:MAG: hypothetical protein WCJ37_15740, partial [Syntrophus sp. (in: bacteria)]
MHLSRGVPYGSPRQEIISPEPPVAIRRQGRTGVPYKMGRVSPASGRPSKARSPGSRSERRKKPESQGRDSHAAKRGAVTALGPQRNKREPSGAEGSGPGKPDGVMRSMTSSGDGGD